ncbi:sigma-70 family RNA polymerase sigma factor [Streptomyces sp. SAJ15]|uniref:sigma-70 family RNA polymerase sigma factor n=1 Tax=Streptomyces sp. SAJ15 TaxID=2011095 RepID=UPI0037D9F7E8
MPQQREPLSGGGGLGRAGGSGSPAGVGGRPGPGADSGPWDATGPEPGTGSSGDAGSTPRPGPSPDPVASDVELVARLRDGDDDAYEELYRRHADAVRRYARTCCRDAYTADDLTAEVFARTLQAVRGGAGPETAVRAYLLTTVRRVAAAWGKSAKREQLVEDFATFAAEAARPAATADTHDLGADVRAMHQAEQSMAVRAFRSLPERYQTVLWHTTVEEESPREVAPLLGLSDNATAVLAHRAREKLKQAYLQAHVSSALTEGGDCARFADRLGAYARGGLRSRAELGLRKHLDHCARCRMAALEVADVNARLRAVLPVAVVGWFAADFSLKAAGVVAGAAGAGAGAAAGASSGAGAGAGAGTAGSGAGAAAGAGAGAGSGGGAGAGVVEGLGAVAKLGIAAGVVVVAAATALALTSGDGDKKTTAGPVAPAAPELPGPATPEPSPSKSAGPKAGPAHAATPPADRRTPSAGASPQPTPSASEKTPTPRPTPPGPTPSAPSEPRPSPTPTSSPTRTPAPTPTPTSPAPSPTPSPTRTPTPEPEPEPPTSYPLSQLRFARFGDGTKPEIRGRESTWLWQRRGMSIGGERYGHGVTVHAASSVTIDLNRPCSAYDAVVGIDDTMLGLGAARFSVYADGERLWRSGVVRGGDPAEPVHVPLSGRSTIRLVVESHGPPGHGLALADWAESRISCS